MLVFTIIMNTCLDIDECEENIDSCGMNSDCKNTHGSYECICRDGFEHDDTGKACRGIFFNIRY